MTPTSLSITDLKTIAQFAFEKSVDNTIREQYSYWDKVMKDCEQEIYNRVVGIWGEIKETI